MGFNINNFLAALDKHHGLQRTNHFKVMILPPRLLVSDSMFRELEFFTEQVTMPGVNFAITDVRRYGYGPIEKRPIGHTFTDLSITFMADGDMKTFITMHRWMNAVTSHDTRDGITTQGSPYLLNYKQDYVSDIAIELYNGRGGTLSETSSSTERIPTPPIMRLIVKEAFPITITDSQFNWADNNSFLRFQVQFAYVDWYLDSNTNE